MPKIYHKVPSFCSYVEKKYLSGYTFENVPFTLLDLPHLAIMRNGKVAARVYRCSMEIVDPVLEIQLSAMASVFESKYSEPDQPVSIKVYCEYER
jgi:hypothetical protein